MTPSDAVMAGNIKFSSEGLEEQAPINDSRADTTEAAAAAVDGKQEAPAA
jgi:hypothetical protein